jgi:hypothetical protein
MATFSFGKDSFHVNFSPKERRALRRTGLTLERDRVLEVSLEPLPAKLDLGVKVSKFLLFGGALGEYRSNTKKLLVLGNAGQSEISLKIRISHPNIDEIWVCGSKGQALHHELLSILGSK